MSTDDDLRAAAIRARKTADTATELVRLLREKLGRAMAAEEEAKRVARDFERAAGMPPP